MHLISSWFFHNWSTGLFHVMLIFVHSKSPVQTGNSISWIDRTALFVKSAYFCLIDQNVLFRGQPDLTDIRTLWVHILY